jgi:hypothetical protein
VEFESSQVLQTVLDCLPVDMQPDCNMIQIGRHPSRAPLFSLHVAPDAPFHFVQGDGRGGEEVQTRMWAFFDKYVDRGGGGEAAVPAVVNVWVSGIYVLPKRHLSVD